MDLGAQHALPAEVRPYDHLFLTPKPDEEEDWKAGLNPNSLETLRKCYVKPSLENETPGARYQLERTGYFCVDPDSSLGHLVFNRTV